MHGPVARAGRCANGEGRATARQQVSREQAAGRDRAGRQQVDFTLNGNRRRI
jgi:hypothetical protein